MDGAIFEEPEGYSFRFDTDGKLMAVVTRSSEAFLEMIDVVRRLLVANASDVCNLALWKEGISNELPTINTTSLASLMERCQSLNVLSLHDLVLDENHCRVLGTRLGLEIKLIRCGLTSSGQSALAVFLGRNQGPTKLGSCDIDNFALADGLRGNSRLKSLSLRFSSNREVGTGEVLAIAGALKENKGLVDFGVSCHRSTWLSDETWGAVCNSLKTHPTLESLNLSEMSIDPTMTPAVLKIRIQALVEMIKMNMSIHTIHLSHRYSNHEFYRESVIPYLGTNRLRPRLLAIQKTRPIAYRTKVLGRALLATRTDANRFWMLLSGNAEVAFPSRTTTIAAATNLPTPAPATSTLTTTATGSLPVAAAAVATRAVIASTVSASNAFASTPAIAVAATAASVATPSAGQKRKAPL